MKKVIIDTDPGVDDALAIVMALRSKSLQIAGLTTVFGNSTLENSTRNALTILELLGADIPVYEGCEKPIQGDNRFATSHGEDGLGGFRIRTKKIKEKLPAQTFLETSLEQEILDIVCIGPVTNIARLLQRRPDLQARVGRLIILGGVFGQEGNISKCAEFNVYNDPVAFKVLLESDVKKVLIPINICRKVVFGKQIFDAIDNPKFSKSLKKITDCYIDYYSNDQKYGGFEGGVMYDLLAVAYLLTESLFTIRNERVNVNTQPGTNYGQTVFATNGCRVKLITDVDEVRLEQQFMKIMN